MEEEFRENVISFRTGKPVPPVKVSEITPVYLGGCDHGEFELDVEAKTVECGICKKQLDAFHVLTLFATTCRMRDYRLEEWRKYTEHQVAEKAKARERNKKWHKKQEKKHLQA